MLRLQELVDKQIGVCDTLKVELADSKNRMELKGRAVAEMNLIRAKRLKICKNLRSARVDINRFRHLIDCVVKAGLAFGAATDRQA